MNKFLKAGLIGAGIAGIVGIGIATLLRKIRITLEIGDLSEEDFGELPIEEEAEVVVLNTSGPSLKIEDMEPLTLDDTTVLEDIDDEID